jgi:uncharacterized protein (DUF111 family)
MRMLIDPQGGIAGDMFSAALISAGADSKMMIDAMLRAAKKLGDAKISVQQTVDRATQLKINLDSNKQHLSEQEARYFLKELFAEMEIEKTYQQFGYQILNILLEAEKKAHSEYNISLPHHHHHNHNNPSINKNGKHSPNHEDITFLHEAQDVIIDIIGAVFGMGDLGVDPAAILISPVSVGGGMVNFSHGNLPVPAPATQIIINRYKLKWKMGPIQSELCTPTGASILAALRSKYNPSFNFSSIKMVSRGQSRGNKILNIPPLKVYIY